MTEHVVEVSAHVSLQDHVRHDGVTAHSFYGALKRLAHDAQDNRSRVGEFANKDHGPIVGSVIGPYEAPPHCASHQAVHDVRTQDAPLHWIQRVHG